MNLTNRRIAPKVKLPNKNHRRKPPTLAVFFMPKIPFCLSCMDRGAYAPVSVYRKVCGKLPVKLVGNTGAFSLYQRGMPPEFYHRRLKMNKNIPIEIGDQVSELVCLLTYHAACLSCYFESLARNADFGDSGYNTYLTSGVYLAFRDLEQRARKIEKALG